MRILQAGLRYVAMYGASRISMSGVAETAKVARGTVYRYFSNGDELLEAVGEFVRASFETRVAALARAEPDPRARLAQLLDEPVDDEIWTAVLRLREFQPAFTLEFLTAHMPDYIKAYRRAFAADFKKNDYGMTLDNFAKTIARIMVTGTLLNDDRSITRRLGLALWDSISAA
jgi:AcrR family transcriptional regulator